MNGKNQENVLPTVAAIEAEAARVESMIIAVSGCEESSESNLNTFMQVHLRKAEMKAYLAGLRYALGHAELIQTRQVVSDLDFPEIETGRSGNVTDDPEVRLVQCFEC